ncbi:DUF1127 domain-containing protein [Pseudomonas sp.]|uniref:DUF1127 domain-containing protein n=1 Tax=Pseudomonas sp. TaxID=306 RepID=UPI003A96914D
MERTLSSDLSFETKSTPVSSNLALNLFATLMLWQRRIVSRRQLARLDSRLLADAGITESQRYSELKKPFWR